MNARPKSVVIERLTNVLFFTPLLAAIPIFFYVRDAIPDINHGSIGDGFRKINAFFAAVCPVALACWGVAILLKIFDGFRTGAIDWKHVAVVLVWIATALLLFSLG